MLSDIFLSLMLRKSLFGLFNISHIVDNCYLYQEGYVLGIVGWSVCLSVRPSDYVKRIERICWVFTRGVSRAKEQSITF